MKKYFFAIAIVGSLLAVGCSKTESFPEAIEQGEEEIVSALVVRPRSLPDQSIEFRVYDEAGEEVVDSLSFFVNGEPISGNIFSSPTVNTFEVYGEYIVDGDTLTTDVEPFEVIIPKRKVLLEDYTGAWCGYCPRMVAAIEAVQALTDDVVPIAIHNNDEMALNPQEEILRDAIGVPGFPHGRINRTLAWNLPHAPEVALPFAGVETDIAIAISSELVGSQINIKVRLTSETAMSSDKLVVYLLEDGILSEQTNYYNNDENSPYYGMGDPIVDFVNDHVLRETYTNILGNPIPETGALQEYSASYSGSISGNYVQENLHVVAMVVTADNTARNVQIAAVNETSDYE